MNNQPFIINGDTDLINTTALSDKNEQMKE